MKRTKLKQAEPVRVGTGGVELGVPSTAPTTLEVVPKQTAESILGSISESALAFSLLELKKFQLHCSDVAWESLGDLDSRFTWEACEVV